MEFEPTRHSPFDTAHGGKERVAYDPSINSGVVPDTYIALSGAVIAVSNKSTDIIIGEKV